MAFSVLPHWSCGFLGTSWVGGRLAGDWFPKFDDEVRLQPEAKGPIALYNFGQGGFTSSQILAQRVPRVLEVQPNHVFIDPGHVNSSADAGGGPAVSRAQTISDIQAMVAQLRDGIPGVDITLCTMHSISATSLTIHPAYYDYVEDVRATAALLDVRLLDTNAAAPKPLDPTLTYGAGPFQIAPTATFDPMPDGTGWNTADKSANVVVGLVDRQALATPAGQGGIRGNTAIAGKKHFEVTVDLKSGNFPYIGIANAAAPLASYIGQTVDGLALRADGAVYRNNASLGASGLVPATGDVIGVEVDRVANLIYFMKGAFRSAGFDISGVAGAIYPAMTVNTLVTGGTARFTPSGDGLHQLFAGYLDTWFYPQLMAWARARMAGFAPWQ